LILGVYFTFSQNKPPESTGGLMTDGPWIGKVKGKVGVQSGGSQMTMVSEVKPREASFSQAAALRFALGVGLSAMSGIMLLLAFPPYGFWPLIWVGFVPYLFAQHRLLPLKWSSLAIAIAMLLWLGPYLARLMGPEVGFFFTYMGVWIAVLCFLLSRERKFHEISGYRWFILYGVIFWVGLEMIRATFIPLIATSGFVGYTQAAQSWLTQPVSIFSVYGLNILIMLVNFSLAQAAIAWYDRRWPSADVVPVNPQATRNWLVATGAILVAWIGLSLFLLNSAPTDTATVQVAALQPNFALPAFQDTETPEQVRLDTFFEQARQAAQQGAQLIFTPEMNFDFDPQVAHTQELRALAKETGAYLFLTYSVTDNEWRNEAVMLSPTGEFSQVYGKNHVFGEPPTPTAGVYPVFDTPLGRLATLICHDANYTDVARRLTKNGAQLIASPINEFGGFGEQYWTNVTFRALENRAAMVFTGRATNSGIIDSYGRQVALAINLDGEQVTLVVDVPLGSGNAPLVRLGDWLGWICLGGLVIFLVFQAVTERRAKKAEQR